MAITSNFTHLFIMDFEIFANKSRSQNINFLFLWAQLGSSKPLKLSKEVRMAMG